MVESVDAEQEYLWLRQAKGGDRTAFARLVSAYQGPVFNLCYRMLGNPAEAEDATQETFLRVYTKMNTYQPDRKLSSWILAIASHHCIDRLRRRRADTVSLDTEPIAEAVPATSGGPEETVLRREAQDEVQRAVDQLDPSYRVPLILRYWHGLSYAEIAEVLGLTVQAVKSRLHRARLQTAAIVAPATTAGATVAPGTVALGAPARSIEPATVR